MELLGITVGLSMIFVLWWILEIIGNWTLFKKAGKPGWHSIIPILNLYDEFDICWNGWLGIVLFFGLFVLSSIPSSVSGKSALMTGVVGFLTVIVVLLQIIESYKLAKAFGKGIGYTLFLIIFDRIGRIVLGFSSAQYVGKQDFLGEEW